MPERSRDWLRQAERDLENARWEIKGGFYEWGCFAAHQAAEKALKAVYQKLGGAAWGHSLLHLLRGLEERISIPEDLFELARKLDVYYIPSRYPNGWEEGAPRDYYTEKEALYAVGAAEEILRFCKGLLAGSGSGSEKSQGKCS
ncbi:HEPN domain-containing protein [Thermosulfurimonas sp. F29]|uniref:HEPN domain-containing protein n=1 Tax=Thermosulfurimonas sp. F29 TaxID=2867247 RepID=UPI001C82CAA6|nr:HEPN domain-containing protein [Thermosulfurimonas sp. F29]